MEANYFLSSQKVVKYCFVPIFPKELFQIAFTAGVSPGCEHQTHPQKWTLPKVPHQIGVAIFQKWFHNNVEKYLSFC